MARNWVIAPYDSGNADLFDTAWDFDLKENTIALGWLEMGDISQLSRDNLESKYRKTYPEQKTKAVITKDVYGLYTMKYTKEMLSWRAGAESVSLR